VPFLAHPVYGAFAIDSPIPSGSVQSENCEIEDKPMEYGEHARSHHRTRE